MFFWRNLFLPILILISERSTTVNFGKTITDQVACFLLGMMYIILLFGSTVGNTLVLINIFTDVGIFYFQFYI